ncbi:hypothetical protein AVEN_258408-1 [Araneus ventricosus]|uniref:Uncharacterized protein n=1 Tax=Araneus ventricosus TaxID=182803 RepID=A0A4Y2KBL8_ARAVE|nr:hypothetical protein AVEN_258408-1 [Araneus ventricosus]
MKLQKRKKKRASYSHISQEPHSFCTKGCNSFRPSGASERTEEVPCSNTGPEKYGRGSNSPRVCAMAATSVNDPKVKGSGQHSSYGQL